MRFRTDYVTFLILYSQDELQPYFCLPKNIHLEAAATIRSITDSNVLPISQPNINRILLAAFRLFKPGKTCIFSQDLTQYFLNPADNPI